MQRWIALSLFLAAGIGAWNAAPAWGAAKVNEANHRECRTWTLFRDGYLFFREYEKITPEPEACRAPRQREEWDTNWLLIAAICATGAGICVATGRARSP